MQRIKPLASCKTALWLLGDDRTGLSKQKCEKKKNAKMQPLDVATDEKLQIRGKRIDCWIQNVEVNYLGPGPGSTVVKENKKMRPRGHSVPS